jgi:hypothetical protein
MDGSIEQWGKTRTRGLIFGVHLYLMVMESSSPEGATENSPGF